MSTGTEEVSPDDRDMDDAPGQLLPITLQPYYPQGRTPTEEAFTTAQEDLAATVTIRYREVGSKKVVFLVTGLDGIQRGRIARNANAMSYNVLKLLSDLDLLGQHDLEVALFCDFSEAEGLGAPPMTAMSQIIELLNREIIPELRIYLAPPRGKDRSFNTTLVDRFIATITRRFGRQFRRLNKTDFDTAFSEELSISEA